MTTYKYKGVEFVVSKPDACAMKVSKGDIEATISIHTATNQYREDVNGWGTDQPTLESALDAACSRILSLEARPSKKQLCEQMDTFYDKLED